MANTQTIENLTAAIAACDTDNEIGPQIVVDPDNPETMPTQVVSGFKLQNLVDAEGTPIGYVDIDGLHIYEKTEILDKDGNTIDLNNAAFITTQFLDTNSLGYVSDFPGYANPSALPGDVDFCVPAAPLCPEIEPQITCDPSNMDQYIWKDSAWSLCNAASSATCVGMGNSTVIPLIIANVGGAIREDDLAVSVVGNGEVGAEYLQHTITNNGCRPLCYEAMIRVAVSAVGWGPGNQIIATLSNTATNNAPWRGSNSFIIDTINSANPNTDARTLMQSHACDIIQPGETVNVGLQAGIEITTWNPDGNGSIRFNGLTGYVKLQRVASDQIEGLISEADTVGP